MRKSVLKLFTTLLLLGVSIPSVAQVGITAVPFLQIEPDSRGAGMGNTGVAIADNASAIFWNPAGLAYQSKNQISITHANWLPAFNADLFYDYLVGTYYVEGIGTIGGHITFLNLGEQERRDSQNIDLGRFNSFELAGGLSYGFELSENFALGTGFRFIYSSLASGDVDGQSISPGASVGVDLAALYKSNPFSLGGRDASINAGFNLSNLGPSIQYTDEAQKDPLPTVLRAGWAFTTELDSRGYNTITIANDISKIMARNERVSGDDEGGGTFEAMNSIEALFRSWGTFEQDQGVENISLSLVDQLMIGTGFEYWYNKQFALRGGYYYEHENNGNREFLTFGAGLRYNVVGVDFSYIYTLEEDHPLADTIRLSLLLTFN